MDAVEKSTGAATFTEDLPLPYGTLYASILHSPYAHARIVSINVEQAESLPGVHAVLTRENLQDIHPFADPASFGEEGAL
jgi:CO/xanthine dehydrogenase Mo-binding subunit